jgi:hypothetical protein
LASIGVACAVFGPSTVLAGPAALWIFAVSAVLGSLPAVWALLTPPRPRRAPVVAGIGSGATAMTLSGFRDGAEAVQWIHLDEALLEAALETRDERGGNQFVLSRDGADFPCLTIYVDGSRAYVHYRPRSRHAGFRCASMIAGLDPDGTSILAFTHCDPGSGEVVPNRFVVPFAAAVLAARDFLATGQRSPRVEWCDL